MTTAEKKRLGYIEPAQAKAKAEVRREKELHEQVISLLRIRGVKFICHSRMDKRSTVRAGTADILFAHRVKWPDDYIPFVIKPCAIELKKPGGELSDAQRACIADMQQDGWEVLVADNLEAVKEWLDRL